MMHYNDVGYWRYLSSLQAPHPDLPSPRVCRLLERTFQRWKEKPLWLDENHLGHLFRDRRDLTRAQRDKISRLSIPVRKAMAIDRTLERITDKKIARKCGTFEVHPDELILGTLPPFSVGQGKEFVGYLTKEEELRGMLNYLNERSPMGHIVPGYVRVVNQGMLSIIKECRDKRKQASKTEIEFYKSVEQSLQAVISFAGRYADEAERTAKLLPKEDPRSESMMACAARLRNVPAHGAQSFIEAVQSIYIIHCALHWTVEIVPLGRLDQLLYPFYDRDIKSKRITKEKAQEILDCLWIKLDERAILNKRHLENRFTACDGVLTGFFGSSNYDQGGLLNQWMQQITIGGVVPNDKKIAEDASNEISMMCLECARRLPLNSPTLDLRVHSKTPNKILEQAARALLSGGAHPVLLHDDKIVSGLLKGGTGISLKAARNYACDGCYETMVAGESEFSFGFVSAPDLIEKALNRGAGLSASGPVHLQGLKDSWRTRPGEEFTSYEQFQEVIAQHMDLACHRYINNLLLNYGNKAAVCPSTLLSALIGGCLESGRDLTDGGSRYHIFSPLLVGISTAADSLFAIRRLVFEEQKVGMGELITSLRTNWGENLIDSNGLSLPVLGTAVSKARILEIRDLCNNQPKFGFGIREVDKIAWDLIDRFCDSVIRSWKENVHQERYKALVKKYKSTSHDFSILLVPGVGTFEQYVFSGSFLGASADGRRSGDTIASDLSPSPVHAYLPATPSDNTRRHTREGSLAESFRSYADNCMDRLGDGAPADYNLPEDYPVEKLVKQLKDFALGKGGSVATFTVANPETFANAQKNPDDYNLLRVRMGGWSEFFVCLFPNHQEQHKRRPLFTK